MTSIARIAKICVRKPTIVFTAANRHRSLWYAVVPIAAILLITTWFDRQFSNLTLEYLLNERLSVNDLLAKQFHGDAASLSATLLTNTLVVFSTNVLIIVLSCGALSAFAQIIKTYEDGRTAFILIGCVWVVFSAYNLNALWWITGYPQLETHFRQITLDYQVQVIDRFNNLVVPATVGDAQNYAGRFINSCPNKFCIHNITMISILYWISLSLVILMAVCGVMAGAIVLSPLERPTSRAAKARSQIKAHAKIGLSDLEDARIRLQPAQTDMEGALLEYRKRVRELRTVLHYGSACLVGAVLWISSHVRWGVGPFFGTVEKVDQLMNGVALYLALLYTVILALAFLPPAIWMRRRLSDKYFNEIDVSSHQTVVAFDKWLTDRGLDATVVTGRDLLAFLAPIASLLAGTILDAPSLAKLAP